MTLFAFEHMYKAIHFYILQLNTMNITWEWY